MDSCLSCNSDLDLKDTAPLEHRVRHMGVVQISRQVLHTVRRLGLYTGEHKECMVLLLLDLALESRLAEVL